MRHAFLIIAHNNWWQLKNLIQMLDYPGHDIYVHIDVKSKGFNAQEFQKITQSSGLYIFRQYKVFWGGYSQVKAEIFLLKQAVKAGYGYYHILSGADLPLKGNQELDAFFERNQGKEFIDYDEDKLKDDPEISRRTRLYHFLQDYRRRYKHKAANGFFTFLERFSLVIQIVLRVNRVKNLDWHIKYGSNWASITDQLAHAVLEREEKIERVFSNTNCPDELFIQTVAFNEGFRDWVYQPDSPGQKSNMRYIDWERGRNGSPYTFTMEDYEALRKANALFARKFSENVDRRVIEALNSEILDG